MIGRIDIRGIKGTPMRAMLVQAGERRPNHPTIVAEKDLIEFYDLRHMHTPDGQFIAEYFAETYMGRDKWGSRPDSGAGLDLMGYEPDWKIGADTRRIVGEWYDYLSFKGEVHA